MPRNILHSQKVHHTHNGILADLLKCLKSEFLWMSMLGRSRGGCPGQISPHHQGPQPPQGSFTLRPITKEQHGTHSAQSMQTPTCSQQGPPGYPPATTAQDLPPPYALIWALTTHPPRVEPGCMSQPTLMVAILSVSNLNTKIHTQSVP